MWILVAPMAPLAQDFIGKTRVLGKPVCLGQRDQMLMPVEFPDNLAVSHLFEVEILDAIEHFPGSLPRVDKIEMPIDGRSVCKVGVSQQIEAVVKDLFRLLDDVRGLLRKPLPDQLQPRIDIARTKEKIPAGSRFRLQHGLSKIEPQQARRCILLHGQFLANSSA
jgi:hypothetical protein